MADNILLFYRRPGGKARYPGPVADRARGSAGLGETEVSASCQQDSSPSGQPSWARISEEGPYGLGLTSSPRLLLWTPTTPADRTAVSTRSGHEPLILRVRDSP